MYQTRIKGARFPHNNYFIMRLLITEEALHTGVGHWPSYIGGLVDGFRSSGDEVDVLAHQEATDEVLERVSGIPWFSRNCWIDRKSQGALGGLLHNFRFLSELNSWLTNKDSYDWICALTMRLQHLLAFALLSRKRNIPPNTRFLLLFVQGFGQFDGPGKPPVFPKTHSNRLARLCFRLLAPAVISKRVMIAAETQGMQKELQSFTGLPVALFPHPVPSPPTNTRLAVRSSVTITCPGFARHEKGNDLLQAATLRLRSEAGYEDIRFICQWPEAFKMPDGTMLGPDPILLKDPRIEFLNELLDAAEYEALLARSDIIVQPYRIKSYHHRVSRAAIEAASRGIPLVYMENTWSEEVASLVGTGVAIHKETPDSVMGALQEALGRLPELQKEAKAGAEKVASYHSHGQFRQILVESTMRRPI